MRATLLLAVPDWVKGVRVRASANQIEPMLIKTLPSAKAEGLPLPRPFPWYTPKQATTGGQVD